MVLEASCEDIKTFEHQSQVQSSNHICLVANALLIIHDKKHRIIYQNIMSLLVKVNASHYR
jgi:hypothetical protein